MDVRLAPVAMSQGGVFLRRQAIACGYSPDEVDRAVRTGLWRRVRRGAYAEPGLVDGASEIALHRLRTHAVIAASESAPVVSGVSAAVLHGLDLSGQNLARFHLTHPGISARIEGDVHHHDASLNDDEIVIVDGLHATSVARTAVDVARDCETFEQGVITMDSALRCERTTLPILTRRSEECSRWPHARGVARMVRFADGRAATPGESRLRVTYAAAGLPPCEPQLYVYRLGGGLLGIADLAAIAQKTLLELDGRMKYGIDGQDPVDQVYREKLREDDLREVGHEVVRFGWAAAGHVSVVAERVRAAFRRAADRPPPQALYRLSTVTGSGVAPVGPLLSWSELVRLLERQQAA